MKRKKRKKRPATQEERLKHAARWVHRYSGRLIIRKYNRKYCISLKDCFKELAMLGLPITMKDLREYRKFQKQQRENKMAKKQRALAQEASVNRDTIEEFCFYCPDGHLIIGYPARRKTAVRDINDLNYVKRIRQFDSLYEF